MNFKVDTDSWFIFSILFISTLALLVFLYVAIPYVTRKRHLMLRKAKYALKEGISIQLNERYTQTKIGTLEKNNQRLKTDLTASLKEILQSQYNGIDLITFFSDFEKIYPDFRHSLQQIVPKITANELKLAALLRLNLSSKEIAKILNISPESVNKARYRLRKKVGLHSKDDLFIFLSSI